MSENGPPPQKTHSFLSSYADSCCRAGVVRGGRDRLEVLVEKVCVHVERHRGRGVTEHALDRLHVRAGAHCEARGRVPEVVDGRLRERRIELLRSRDRCTHQPPCTVG